MFPARDPPRFFRAACTLRADRTGSACWCRVIACEPSRFIGRKSIGQHGPSRTAIGILVCVIGELRFGEQTSFLVARRVGLRHIRRNPSVQTPLHLGPIVVVHISDHVHRIDREHLLYPYSYRRQLGAIGDFVRDLMLDDQLVLAIHGHLDVVAHLSPLRHRHRTTVGIGQRELGSFTRGELLLI